METSALILKNVDQAFLTISSEIKNRLEAREMFILIMRMDNFQPKEQPIEERGVASFLPKSNTEVKSQDVEARTKQEYEQEINTLKSQLNSITQEKEQQINAITIQTNKEVQKYIHQINTLKELHDVTQECKQQIDALNLKRNQRYEKQINDLKDKLKKSTNEHEQQIFKLNTQIKESSKEISVLKQGESFLCFSEILRKSKIQRISSKSIRN